MVKATATQTKARETETGAPCSELQEALTRMPFKVHLSFEPLFKTIDELLSGCENPYTREARNQVDACRHAEELRGTITSPEVLERHREGIRFLMGFVFSELTADHVPGRAHAPFAPESFFTTRAFDKVFNSPDVEVFDGNALQKRDFYRANLFFAYTMLYTLHFGVEHSKKVFVKRLRQKSTGLDRFFLVDSDFRFVEVSHPGLEIPPQKEFARLLDMEDLDELRRCLPLDDVVFTGFNFLRYIEITELHNLSLLKSELVEPDMLNSPERFLRIVDRLRSILQVSDLDAGLTLRHKSGHEYRYCAARSLLKDFEGGLDDIESTIYGDPIRDKVPLFVPDLGECDCDSDVVAHLRSRGIRSVGLIPLLDGGEVIGILELTSRQPDEIHPSSARKLADLLAPLTIAAQRVMDETQGRIERTIKAHCTAIHPSVGWRFEEAAYRYNTELVETGTARFEDIVFEGVHPLYGAMDIRGSSVSRNTAIQTDLVEHIDLARALLARIHAHHPMPIADYYDAALARFRAAVSKGLRSGDEISVIDFLHQRVEPFFDYIREHMPLPVEDGESDAVEGYYANMDPSMRILYKRRKDYEDSVTLINETLGALVDREEEQAQAIFPHYFEKYKTDGVEYNIYIGQAMTRALEFDEVQLKNLRLWQLQLMCKMARRAEELVPDMQVPLRTTPLVLVHASPLTIHFSTESKQFEVEGSYNIRYEIIKKRIDKATVRGASERLTQPGLLAVIYTQDKERDEYQRYFEYLAEKGLVRGEIENLELDDLQGVHGLRALRAAIVLD